MHNLKVKSYVYSAGIFRERASHIKLFGRGNGEPSIYARIDRSFCNNNMYSEQKFIVNKRKTDTPS